jgi:NADH-quinone oxidoreductase subunit D
VTSPKKAPKAPRRSAETVVAPAIQRPQDIIPSGDPDIPGGSGLLHTETMTLNVGPQHPSTHGVLRLVVDLEGERVTRVQPVIGYLHTGFEKTMENRTYMQNFTFAPRMDYVHGMAYELAYALSAEQLLAAEVPDRARLIRVLLVELNRIASHLVFVASGMLDLGAITPFFYLLEEREVILDMLEATTGYRMNYGYLRVGGVARDLPEGLEEWCAKFLDRVEPRIDEGENLYRGNPIFIDRTKGVGVLSAEQAVELSLTGPNLRASGVKLDLRKDRPYGGYEDFDFDVPVGAAGDSFDRFSVRVEEMRQSVRICRQVLQKLKPGPINDPNRKISLPPRSELETSMEAVIYHFKLVTEGYHPPRAEAYVPTESARGELGCYLVSDGGSMPYRIRWRSPSFYNLQALPVAGVGGLFADLITVIASLDPVLGDVDR